MVRNEVGYVVVIPDNFENSDSIADLDKAIQLAGKYSNVFSWEVHKLFKEVQANWKNT